MSSKSFLLQRKFANRLATTLINLSILQSGSMLLTTSGGRGPHSPSQYQIRHLVCKLTTRARTQLLALPSLNCFILYTSLYPDMTAHYLAVGFDPATFLIKVKNTRGGGDFVLEHCTAGQVFYIRLIISDFKVLFLIKGC